MSALDLTPSARLGVQRLLHEADDGAHDNDDDESHCDQDLHKTNDSYPPT